MDKQLKYLWLTDCHTKIVDRFRLLNAVLQSRPYGVFLTGDMSEGFAFLSDLEFLGKKIGRPLYFVLGNHEFWGSSFEKTYNGVRALCQQYKNLIWLDEAGIVPLNEQTACIGIGGWYDARTGNPDYLKYTFDWWAIKDFRQLPNMKARIEKFRAIADESAKIITARLEEAIETYKVVYLLTHYPPYVEADRANNWISEKFYEPYNTNVVLGQAIDKVMEKHKKRYLHILCGHTHSPVQIVRSRNVECRVGRGSYYKISDEEIIYI